MGHLPSLDALDTAGETAAGDDCYRDTLPIIPDPLSDDSIPSTSSVCAPALASLDDCSYLNTSPLPQSSLSTPPDLALVDWGLLADALQPGFPVKGPSLPCESATVSPAAGHINTETSETTIPTMPESSGQSSREGESASGSSTASTLPPLLHVAARSRNYNVLATLLKHGVEEVDKRDQDKSTALHASVELGDEALVALLLRHGASISAHDVLGQTPLYLAVLGGHDDVLELLLGHAGVVGLL